MADEPVPQLEDLEKLSNDMLVVANQQDWQTLQKLEEDRVRLVNDLKFHPPLSPEIIRALQSISAVNQKVVALCEAARDQSSTALNSINVARKAFDEYKKNF